MHRLAVAFAVLGVLLIGGVARADALGSARDQPLVEVSHAVELRIVDGVAVFKVRRTFANNGGQTDEARLAIDLPPGAAVTGLRIRARERWYDADLLEREEAARRYQELTSMGAWAPKDPALLQWVWADRMRLQVFPIAPGAASTVEYTLTVPLQYAKGLHIVSYPRSDGTAAESLPLAVPVLTIDPGYGDATTALFVDDQRVAPGAPMVLVPPAQPRWIGAGEPDLSAGYAWSRIDVAESGVATRAEIEVDIDHTYRGDLSLELVTPSGEYLEVERFAGDENDVRERFTVELPPGTASAGAWHLAAADHAGMDVGTIERWKLRLAGEAEATSKASASPLYVSSDTPVFIPDAPRGDGEEGVARIELAPDAIDRAQARFGRVRVRPDLSFLRLEVEAAPQLAEIPRAPAVVFVVDASRSVDDIAWQLAVAEAYLAHVPDARVEVVAFRRYAERVFDDFVAARDFPARAQQAVGAGRFEAGNGSAIERGLAEASASLAGVRGPRRVVVLSDALLRSRYADADARLAVAELPKGTIVHVVVPTGARDDDLQFLREDTHFLSPVASRTGGVLFRLSGDAVQDGKGLVSSVLGLVRPIGIDHFRVAGKGLEGAPTPPETLGEGQGYRFMLQSSESPDELIVDGMIWGRRFHREVAADRAFGRSTAAFVFSEDEYHQLTEAEMMTVALHGRAVSPVTSYLAIEPGVRPSTAGFGEEAIGFGSGGGSFGSGGLGLSGIGHGGGGMPPSTLEELTAAGVERCAQRYAPPPEWRVELEVETTFREIVDVRAASASPVVSGELRACVVEAAWAVALTWNFQDERHLWPLVLPAR